MKSTNTKTEKEIENEILQYLDLRNGCTFWKINTVGVFDPVRKVYRKPKSKWNTKGVPDIIGFFNGEFFAFEVKTYKTKNRTSDSQKAFIAAANTFKEQAFVVWDVEQVKDILNGKR